MAHSCGPSFCVVDVAECATAMNEVLPGGRTPVWLVHDPRVIVWLAACMWVFAVWCCGWVIHARCVTEGFLRWCTVGCLGQHRFFVCPCWAPCREPAAVIVVRFRVGGCVV